jgi:hypothetical protein
MGVSPIQSRDFWITETAKAFWNADQFNKIDQELVRLESQLCVFGLNHRWSRGQ